MRWPSARVNAASTTRASVAPVTSTLVLWSDESAASMTEYSSVDMTVTLGTFSRFLPVTAGDEVVKMGQASIRRVRFQAPSASVGDIEVNTVKGIRDRGGPRE